MLDFPFGPAYTTSYLAGSASFQSLFCWISLSDLRFTTKISQLILFQSLFCWISLSDLYSRLQKLTQSSGFQSLFCWISLSDFSRFLFVTLTYDSFNPCFAGFPFRTDDVDNTNSKLKVSILVLLDFPFGLIRQYQNFQSLPVSILVLLDFPFGLRSYSRWYKSCRWYYLDVSILVLLDFPFGLGLILRRLKLYISWVSILVLLDFPFGPS